MLALDDPGGTVGLADLAAAANLDDHLQTVTLLPPTTRKALAEEILIALGKRSDVRPCARSLTRAWQLVSIWRTVLYSHTLVLINAEFLDPRCLPLLADLDGEVLLIFDSCSAPPALLQQIERHSTSRTVDSGDPWMDRLRTPITRARRVHPSAPFPACPTDAFPHFLPACELTLDDDDLRRVQAAYSNAQRAAIDSIDSHDRVGYDVAHEDIEAAARFIRDTIADSTDTHEQLAMIRGIEHAFHHRGYLLRADPAQLRTPKLPDLQTLRERVGWYVEPRSAAIAALAAAGMTAATIADLNTDRIYRYPNRSPTIRWSRIGASDMRPILTPALEAYWHADINNKDHATQQGPLFRSPSGHRRTTKNIKRELRHIAAETGLPLASHWTPPADQRATAWMRQSGITLSQL